MRTTFLMFCLLISLGSFAQSAQLIVKGTDKGLYIEHKVIAKDNLSSVGRKYEISAAEIASFNGFSADKGLLLDQMIKIPLTVSNFNQDPGNTSGVPVIHVVIISDGLLRLSSKYHVKVESLKKWNQLADDKIKLGDNLIVGYLKAKLSLQHSDVIELSKSETASQANVSLPVENKKTESVAAVTPVAVPVEAKVLSTTNDSDTSKVINQSDEEVKLSNNEPSAKMPQGLGVSKIPGFFSSEYGQQSKAGKPQKLEGVIYGSFKSSSGWDDGKYYILFNNVVPGTIVKISVKGSEKYVFAKVLGVVPPGKGSEGMSMLMSSSTASALGLGDIRQNLALVWF